MNSNGAPDPRNRAIAMASLRAVVAGYLIYLGGRLIYDYYHGTSEMALWMTWFFGVVFILAGSAFALYTWKRYQKEKREQPDVTSSEGSSPEETEASALTTEGTEENAEAPSRTDDQEL
jgi:hypothetical protein